MRYTKQSLHRQQLFGFLHQLSANKMGFHFETRPQLRHWPSLAELLPSFWKIDPRNDYANTGKENHDSGPKIVLVFAVLQKVNQADLYNGEFAGCDQNISCFGSFHYHVQ